LSFKVLLNKSIMRKSFLLLYLATAAILTAALGLVYVTVQQSYRQGANDPQIALANEIRERQAAKLPVEQYFVSNGIDLSRSLGVFAVLYDQQGVPLRSSALLDGQMPRVPPGVLEHAFRQGEDRVTWQPRPSVRMAMVVVRAGTDSASCIAVGRSLREVENREQDLRWMVFVCWLAVMGVIGLTGLISLTWIK
jgi:hypothetical protein